MPHPLLKNYATHRSLRIYQWLYAQQKQNRKVTEVSESSQDIQPISRKALIVSTDLTLISYLTNRLMQNFHFDDVELARTKEDLLARAEGQFLWVIVSEDFPAVGLQAISKIFSYPTKNILMLIGECAPELARRLGFDVVLKKDIGAGH